MKTTATKTKIVKKKSEDVAVPVYDHTGKKTGEVSLPGHMFGVSWNADLVHQVVEGMRANARQGNANTKGRGEVRGGGKKPWKQKGTGRARHGSSRSPIWVGGGVTHGPKSEKNYKVTLTSSMKNRALASMLSRKLKEGKILFTDTIDIQNIKTKEAQAILSTLAGISGFDRMVGAKKKVVFMAHATSDSKFTQSFRNLAPVSVGSVRLMNILDVANHTHIVFVGAKEAGEQLAKKV
ncbi:MAG: 50S ribosomal protein L4 [Candidatus Pacebacteria bacterium]|nr:50S ribosomal protein L4 [Candidatus Paceibacterota bacterium]